MILALSRTAHGAQNAVTQTLDDGTTLVWELLDEAPADALLAEQVEVGDGWLMRHDRIDFPAGGIAYRHTHPGPGIRYLLSGSVRIESGGEKPNAVSSGKMPAGERPSPSIFRGPAVGALAAASWSKPIPHARPVRPTTIGTVAPSRRHDEWMSSRTKRRSSPVVESHPGVVTSTSCVAPASGEVAGGIDAGAT